mmetsp:Transcript_27425/g.69264  ORF Transcript_27425/g.69264 Transcript_27425/m.69264 type:complete len:176 (+) Transcript_27425:139-666(+)
MQSRAACRHPTAAVFLMCEVSSMGHAQAYRRVWINRASYLSDRLVCTAWHGSPPTLEHQVIHKDFDPSNNTPDNIRWGTLSENQQHSYEFNPTRKSNVGALSKPVRGRKQDTMDGWMHFESCSAAARELGPVFGPANIAAVASGVRPYTCGWTFEFTQCEVIPGEVWKDVVLYRV